MSANLRLMTRRLLPRVPHRCKSLASKRPERLAEARAQMLEGPNETLYPRIAPDARAVPIAELRKTFERLESGAKDLETEVTVRGRIMGIRELSSKLCFYSVHADGQKVQVVASLKAVGGEKDAFVEKSSLLRVGDIVSVTGNPGRTDKGELSVFATSYLSLLAPSLHALPETIADPVKRLQNRHVDLLVHPPAAQVLRLRSAIFSHIRSHFLARRFIEVHTPILSDGSGGAIAAPFTTEATTSYRDRGGRKLALRIAPELWLKRLVVGGLDRVFELGPVFRNEGVDATHNPEFYTAEFYQAYAGLEDLLAETEALFRGVAAMAAARRSEWPDLPLPATDWAAPWARLEFVPALEQAMGRPLPDVEGPGAAAALETLFGELGLELPEGARSVPRMLDRLAGALLEPQCRAPTFITHHPAALSPLSKTGVRGGRRVAMRAELFVAGRELVNAYEEENSPAEQRRKFALQRAAREAAAKAGVGLAESDGGDESYCEALEWGLPPTAGWGLGVDRLVMLFSGRERIGEVMSFGGIRGAVGLGRAAAGAEGEGKEEAQIEAALQENGEGLDEEDEKKADARGETYAV